MIPGLFSLLGGEQSERSLPHEPVNMPIGDENAAPGEGRRMGVANQRRPLSTIDGNIRETTLLTRSRAKAAALAEKNLVNPAVTKRELRSTKAPPAAQSSVPTAAFDGAPRTRARASCGSTRPAGSSMSNVLQARSESARPRRTSASAEQLVPQSPLPDIDSADRGNYLYETEYVQDIYDYYRAVEMRYCVQHYMENQPDINDKMRSILIDWLVEVHLKFRLMPETLFLTVQIIDRYLTGNRVTRKNLQLVGVTAMLIASKYEEIWAPEVRDFEFICDHAYTQKEILAMEKLMLNKLQFKVTCPTSYHFLARFIKACGHTEKRFNMLCMYAVEISFPDYSMMGHAYSKISAASVLLARQVLNAGPWTHTLDRHTGYSQADLQPIVDHMKSLMVKASNPEASLKAVYKKYSNVRFHEVAKIVC